MDVQSVIQQTISNQINKMSPTEVTLLQRRVRTVVRSFLSSEGRSKSSSNKLGVMTQMNRLLPNKNNGASSQHQHQDSLLEGRPLLDKFHQLDETSLKKIFANGNSLLTDGYNPLSSFFVLGAHLSSDHLRDRTYQIACDSAKRAGVIMDANKQQSHSHKPPPVSLKDYIPSEPLEGIMGIQFPSLAYLVSLGLCEYTEFSMQFLSFILS